MIYIDLKNNPPPQELIDEGQRLTAELMLLPADERKAFIEKHANYWGKLKAHLKKLSDGKCWYSEAHDVASEYHVDHFRPKNQTKGLKRDCDILTISNAEPYWWLAFDWENYRLSGSIPNTSKNAYFPLRIATVIAKCKNEIRDEVPGLLDPTDEDDVLWITFGEDGQVYPACDNDDSWEAQRVKLSARVYNLNCPSLVDARKEVQNTCKRIIEDIKNMQADVKNNNNPIVRAQLKAKVKELRDKTKPKSELSAVATSYILSQPETYIRKIAS
ncbi:MAG: hypothetical protein ACK5H4_13575 [Lacrimispora sphenoides]